MIREMTAADMEALSELYTAYWGEKSNVAKMREKFSALAKNPAYIFLCAEVGGVVAGSVTGVVTEDLYGECAPFLVLENMVVAENFRRKGIGRALFSELENRARARGCSQIHLVTERRRVDAHAFYESLGFSPHSHTGFKKKI